MPEAFLGDCLIYEEALPVVWTEGALAEGLALARLNADNHQLLGAEASLDEVRVHEALKDESPALVHELQRLEYKVNILLRLTSEFILRSSGLPPPQRVRLTSRALEWYGRDAGRRQHGPLVHLRQLGAASTGKNSLCRLRRAARRQFARRAIALQWLERGGDGAAGKTHLSASSAARRRSAPRDALASNSKSLHLFLRVYLTGVAWICHVLFCQPHRL